MANYTLPEDIVFSILLWLPVIDLLRFRSVCKSWCAFIDSSSFINKHLLHQDRTNNDGALIILTRRGINWCLLSGHQFEDRACLDLATPLSVHIPQLSNHCLPKMIASCNGIICLRIAPSCDDLYGSIWRFDLHGIRWRLALWNPATKQFKSLPDPPSYTTKYWNGLLAFGCAAKTVDYKVVRVCDLRSTDSSLSVTYVRVDVYSLHTDAWRTITAELPTCGRLFGDGATYSDGHCSWLFYKPENQNTSYLYSILSFDLSDEAFKATPLPVVPSSRPQLTTIRDSIACIDFIDLFLQSGHGRFDIWVLSEFGVMESWTKLYTISLIGNFESFKPEGLSKNGKFLLLRYQDVSGCHLALADRNTQEIKNIPIDFWNVAIFKESLVSIKKILHPIDASCVV